MIIHEPKRNIVSVDVPNVNFMVSLMVMVMNLIIYVESYAELHDDDNSLFDKNGELTKTEDEIIKEATVKELNLNLDRMIEGEISQYTFAGLKIRKM